MLCSSKKAVVKAAQQLLFGQFLRMKFDQLSKYWLVFAMRSLLVISYRMDFLWDLATGKWLEGPLLHCPEYRFLLLEIWGSDSQKC